jgi:hypothetical protein
MGTDRRDYPFWVRIALWGISDRGSAWLYCWISLVIALGCVAIGFFDWRFFLGGLLVVAAVGYYLAIRWVDRHGRW